MAFMNTLVSTSKNVERKRDKWSMYKPHSSAITDVPLGLATDIFHLLVFFLNLIFQINDKEKRTTV